MKIFKPITPGQRGRKGTDFSVLTKKEPEKSLLLTFKQRAGRNNMGRITVRHQGGGVKKLYRIIEWRQDKLDIPAKVAALEYDPYRNAFIALIEYQDKVKKYIIAPQGLKQGDEIVFSEKAPLKPGNRMKIKNIPVGTVIHNIEIQPGAGGKLVRGAGTGAKVLAQEEKYTQVEMPSTETRKIFNECFASIGSLSNPEHRFIVLGKAGRNRLMGKRPTVRGSAMSPVSHPHGGGEGRTGIGLKRSKTPWGKTAYGVKTRRRKITDKYIIQRRKKK